MDHIRMEPAFADLYADAKAELASGYERADRCVCEFADAHGISPEDAWLLIGQEAALRGDEMIRYVSGNPLDGLSDERRNVRRRLRRGTAAALDPIWERLRAFGGRRR